MRRVGLVGLVLACAACAGKSNSVGRSGGGAAPSGGTGAAAANGGTGASMVTGGNSGEGGSGGPMTSGGTGAIDVTGGSSTGGSSGGAMATGGTETGGTGASDTGGRGGGDTGGAGGTAGIGEGGMPSAMGGSAGMQVTPITSCTDEFPFLGTWEGNILDFYFEPTEDLRLVIADTDGVVGGTLTFGEGDPLPPPESADVPYPPGFWDDPNRFEDVSYIAPWPGFPHTLVRGAGCDSAFRFGISAAEIFQDWCAMQVPVYTPNYGWACTLQGGGSLTTDTCVVQTREGLSESYPRWKCLACGFVDRGVCACDEAGCFADLEATHTYDLMLADTSSGPVLSGPDSRCGDCTVRLELVE